MAERDLILDIIEKRTGNAMRDAADDMDRLADRTDRTGRTMKEFNRDLEIQRQKVTDLSRAWANTGDPKILKDLKAAERELGNFERIADRLALAGEQSGMSFAQAFVSSVGDIAMQLRPAAIGIGVMIAGTAAPFIGAAIGGAILGAVGVGGVVGGIFAAKNDPAVKAAAADFGKGISKEFQLDGKVMVQPIVESLDILRKGFTDLHLEKTFEAAAPLVKSLATGVAGFGTNFMVGFNDAISHAGPAVNVLQQRLPELGSALGGMIDNFTKSKGAVEALDASLVALNQTISFIGRAGKALGDTYHDVLEFRRFLRGEGGSMWDEGAIAGQKMATVVGEIVPKAMGAAKDAAQQLAEANTALNQTYANWFNSAMSADQLNIKIAQDTLTLKQAVDQHGASLSMNTEAGLQNRQMLLGLVADYEAQREKASTSAAATAAASVKFHEQVGALEALATKLGFTKKQIDDLLGSYMDLYGAPNITKTITIKTYTTNAGAITQFNTGKAIGFDTGGWVPGPVGAPVPAIVHGGEYVLSHDMLKGRMPMPSTVSSGPRATAPTYVINVSVPATANQAETGRVVVEAIREYERRSGASWRS